MTSPTLHLTVQGTGTAAAVALSFGRGSTQWLAEVKRPALPPRVACIRPAVVAHERDESEGVVIRAGSWDHALWPTRADPLTHAGPTLPILMSPQPSASTPRPTSTIALGVALGAAIGAAVGVATDNVGVWLPIAIAVGLALGSAKASRQRGD